MCATYASLHFEQDRESMIRRFQSKVNKTGQCWNWTAQRHGHGYGVFWINRRSRLAHRVAWLIAKEEDPSESCVLHRCDNRRCVRPDHLFLGTRADNARDRDAKGRLHGPNNPCKGEQQHAVTLGSTSNKGKQ